MRGELIVLLALVSCCLAALPSQVLNLTNWGLQLPTGKEGDPDFIAPDKLATFEEKPYFYASGSSVIFFAFVNGSHTSGSEYPRTELREYLGGQPASWSNTKGSHTLTVKHAYTHLPAKRPEIVGAQILSDSGPVMQVRLNNPDIEVYGPDGNVKIVPNYVLGTTVTTTVIAADGLIQVLYNGEAKWKVSHSGTGWYFKTGAYVQSNLNYDAPSEYGEVTVYDVTVVHTS